MEERSQTTGAAVGVVDQNFFIELGQRIRDRRKAKGLTQAQVAECLEFSQPTIQAFETGRRRIPVSLLPPLAELLDTSVEELLGVSGQRRRSRGRPSRLEKQFEVVAQLPQKKQRLISEVLDTLIEQAS